MNILNDFFRKFFVAPRIFRVMSGTLKGLNIYMAPRHGIKKILGTYEPEVVTALNHVVNADDVCIDAGCHIGYIALVLRKIVGKGGFVLAIDPIEANCVCVDNSAKANGFENIKTGAYALGDSNSEATAHTFDDSNMANFMDSGFVNYSKKNETIFHVKTLDTVVNENHLSKVDFIKVDVEGYEYKLLIGAKEIIAKDHPKFLIEVPSSKIWPEIYDLLNNAGYEFADLRQNKITKETYLNAPDVFHVVAKTEK